MCYLHSCPTYTTCKLFARLRVQALIPWCALHRNTLILIQKQPQYLFDMHGNALFEVRPKFKVMNEWIDQNNEIIQDQPTWCIYITVEQISWCIYSVLASISEIDPDVCHATTSLHMLPWRAIAQDYWLILSWFTVHNNVVITWYYYSV